MASRANADARDCGNGVAGNAVSGASSPVTPRAPIRSMACTCPPCGRKRDPVRSASRRRSRPGTADVCRLSRHEVKTTIPPRLSARWLDYMPVRISPAVPASSIAANGILSISIRICADCSQSTRQRECRTWSCAGAPDDPAGPATVQGAKRPWRTGSATASRCLLLWSPAQITTKSALVSASPAVSFANSTEPPAPLPSLS